MRAKLWRRFVPAPLLILLCFAFNAFAQTAPPDDSTPGLELRGENETGEKQTDADQDNPSDRLQWERQAWGVVTPSFRQTAIKEGKKHADKKNAFGPKWVSIGPTGAQYEQNGSFTGLVRDSGRARTILTHPTDPDIVYVLTSGGGLWRTNNWTADNTRWTVLTDDLPTTGGGSAAFGRNPNTLYLGLGDPYDQILVGGSMVKSKNGGVTWSPMIELGNAVSVRDVKVDTSTDRDIVFVATDSGLYRSGDEGETYAAVPAFAGQSVWSIVKSSAGWLVSSQPCNPAFVGLQCDGATTLYVSNDLGVTWTPITNAGNIFAGNGRTTLGVAVPGDSVVYAYSSTVGDAQMKDVYRSADGGQTWVANGVNSTKAPTNPNSSMANMNICQTQCWYNQMILVDPQDSSRNTVWIGGNLAAAQTTNGGATWTLKTWWLYSQIPGLPYAHADYHAAAFKSTGTPTIIFGNDGGFNISTDNGASFSSDKNNGLVTHLYYTVTGNAQFPNLVLGGLQDNGTRLRTDNGTIHNQVVGGDGLGAAYSQENTNTVFGSAQGSSMRTNLSNTPPIVFQNWAAATSGLSDSAGFGFSTAIIPAPTGLDPSGRIFFHFSASRVWRTDNGGLSWTRIASATAPTSTGLPASRRFRSSPYNLSVSPTDLKRIAVGAGGGFLDITTDGGTTWTDINLVAAVPGYQGFVTNVNWQDSKTLWITSVAQAAGSIRVIKATIANAGDAWSTATFTPLQNGLPDLPVTRIYFDPRDPSRSTIYAATHVGIYRTVDGGQNWDPYGTGLPNVRVNDIYMPPDGGFIRIATYGRGVWELPQLELVNAMLTDDGASCDRDGVLDNGETGHLVITLKNQGGNNVERVAVTVTSSNPAVTFPFGNSFNFPPVHKYDTRTGAIAVALNGADPISATDFQISVSAPEFGLPSGVNFISTQRLNYDEQKSAATVETVEAAFPNWSISGDPTTTPNVNAWQRRELSPTRHVFWGPDNNGQTDGVKADLPDQQALLSPSMHVGAGPLVISFEHRFSFESGGWDGGVVELSTDNGASWTDIGTAAYNGALNASSSSPIGAGHKAFVNRMAGWPNFAPVTLNLGTAFANQDIRIRFRVGSDESTGAPGWDVDNISVSGITNTPFTALVPNACVVSSRK